MRKPVFGISDEARHKNQVVQPNKMDRGLKFRMIDECSGNKGANLLACTFVFAYSERSIVVISTAHHGGPGETERLLTYLLVLYIHKSVRQLTKATLRKHAHAIFCNFHDSKNGNFQIKKLTFFLIFLNEAVLTCTHNLCFEQK